MKDTRAIIREHAEGMRQAGPKANDFTTLLRAIVPPEAEEELENFIELHFALTDDFIKSLHGQQGK